MGGVEKELFNGAPFQLCDRTSVLDGGGVAKAPPQDALTATSPHA